MSLVIDTSILIDLEKGKEEIIKIFMELKNQYPSKPKISFVAKFEFLFVLKNKSPKNKEEAQKFMNEFETMHTTELTIKNLVLLREKYELPISDLIIATQTMEHGDTLVTKDKDFEQITEIDKIIL